MDKRGVKVLVALTPLAGALAFPLAVPLVMKHMGIPAAVLTAVVVGTVWFIAMLRTSELPQH
ncbi:hypothetical protein NZK27_13365 [Synechococcus sp. FGCU-3]|jgi:hypothetical protein|nr:hypothetical protein [Synechococcus sp. FGCU3]MEB3194496.1 hypothetical protein [Cyanobacteriota bacterium]